MKKKILLIYIRGIEFFQTYLLPEPMVYLLSKHLVIYPMGLLYLSGYLKDHLPSIDDYEIKLLPLDDSTSDETKALIRQEIENNPPMLVGVPLITLGLFSSYQIIKYIKSVDSNVHITVGGPHAMEFPIQTIELPEIDSVHVGYGEKTLLEQVKAMEASKWPTHIDGILTKEDKSSYDIRQQFQKMDINELSYPDMTLMEDNNIQFFYKRKKITGTMTSRGCPFRCTYCATTRHYNFRSVENIIGELQYHQDRGYEVVHFYDELLNHSKKRVLDLCDAMIKKGLRIAWGSNMRVKPMDEEMADALYQANCEFLGFGVETGSDRILKMVKKDCTTEDALRAFEVLRPKKFILRANFMLGFPDETEEEMDNTIQLACDLEPDLVQFTGMGIFPGTEMYTEAVKNGYLDPSDYYKYISNPEFPLAVECWRASHSHEFINKKLKEAYRRFYLRPSYIYRSWKNEKDMEVSFLERAKMAMIIFKYALY